MSLIGISVQVKIDGLKKFAQYFTSPVADPVRKMYVQWGARMRGFLQERFNTYSRGGGDWPDLAASTKEQRRGPAKHNKGKARKFSILRDTNTLYTALDTTFANAPGAIQEDLENGIRIGFGGAARYQNGKSIATIADIAGFHQLGMGYNPIRQIIVGPDPQTLQGMQKDGDRAIKGMIDESGSN